MAEDVVAHFVAKVRQNFVGGFLLQSGVPNDDALGRSKTVHRRIGSNGFIAGFHPEHALRRNFLASAAGDALKLGDKLWSMGGKRLIFVKEWVDYIRRNEDDKEKDRQRDDPELDPPTSWALANDSVENPHKQAADNDRD